MSSYIKKLKHPITGKMQAVLCIDDYFGSHKYGYAFRKDGKNADWNTMFDDCRFFRQDELLIKTK